MNMTCTKFQHKGRATRSRHVRGTTHGEPVIVGTPIVAAVMCRVDIVDVVLVITQEQKDNESESVCRITHIESMAG